MNLSEKHEILKQPMTQSTSPQRLDGIIKAACDKLRRDGLNVMQYMEELSWMLFLKALEATEENNRARAEFDKKPYVSLIPETLQWQQWAENNQYPKRSDNWRSPVIETAQMHTHLNHPETGLFKQLSNLKGSSERQKIAQIFKALGQTRSKEGATLYDVIREINKIDFHSHDDKFALGKIYEDLLAESGRVGGFSGEFYTPRPLVRFLWCNA